MRKVIALACCISVPAFATEGGPGGSGQISFGGPGGTGYTNQQSANVANGGAGGSVSGVTGGSVAPITIRTSPTSGASIGNVTSSINQQSNFGGYAPPVYLPPPNPNSCRGAKAALSLGAGEGAAASMGLSWTEEDQLCVLGYVIPMLQSQIYSPVTTPVQRGIYAKQIEGYMRKLPMFQEVMAEWTATESGRNSLVPIYLDTEQQNLAKNQMGIVPPGQKLSAYAQKKNRARHTKTKLKLVSTRKPWQPLKAKKLRVFPG